MRIPPLYNDKSWQRLFAGFILGLIFGWIFFLFHFGHVYEKIIMDNRELNSTIERQERRIESLEKENSEKNRDLQESITIQEIEITFTNEADVNISELTLHELKNRLEDELESVRGRNVETIVESYDILIRTMENAQISISGNDYSVEVEELFILSATVRMGLRIKSAE
ncbi:hypothetical protein J2S74_001603 [Evansella vedderi]|uniref:Sporulation membrane protein YtrI C-terminal domain-containing protein n=1 Tax=Evansella vedderi TaxID=38282 RepID=A0ABT9ZUU3_9BACI|nr:sporulation membrane protein YtrI [Evansella vedderi]MDQ0254228.1 hypothetical protein [Evansella vedderi]